VRNSPQGTSCALLSAIFFDFGGAPARGPPLHARLAYLLTPL
jgi:hypothetical protein